VGGDTLARSLEVAQPFSDMVGIVRTDTGFGGAAAKNINLNFMFIQRDRYQLDVLRALLEREQITPVIDSVLPLSDVAEAHRRLESGGVKGKIVLSVREE
jgi:NADPH2:quinone reductase